MACVWKRPRLHSVNVLSHYRAREKRHATSSFKISSEQNRALQVRLLSKKAKIAMATLTSKTVTILNLMHHIVCPVHVHIRKSHYKIGIVSFANSKKWCFPKLLKLSFDWLLVTFQCWTACSLHCFGCATQYTRPWGSTIKIFIISGFQTSSQDGWYYFYTKNTFNRDFSENLRIAGRNISCNNTLGTPNNCLKTKWNVQIIKCVC